LRILFADSFCGFFWWWDPRFLPVPGPIMSVVIETTLGDITVDLYLLERPQTCRNFLALCALKYYNTVGFHFVQADFIAQTGDPTGTGAGGESAWAAVHGAEGRFIEATERSRPPKLKHDRS